MQDPYANTPPGGPALAAFMRALQRLCDCLMLAMVALIVVGVTAREMLGVGLDFTEEYSGYLLVAITCIASAISQYRDSHFRVEIFTSRLSTRAKDVLFLVWDIGAFAFSSVALWQLTLHVHSSYVRQIVSTTAMGTKQYIPQIVMPLGFALLVVILGVQIVVKVKFLTSRTTGN